MEPFKLFIEAFKQLPQLFSTIGALISSPIKFIGGQIDDESTESLSRAFMFASVSAFIAIVAFHLVLQRLDFTKLLIIPGLINVIEIIFMFIIFSIGFKVISCPISSHKIVITVL